jgi:hypothetical protein
MPMGTANYHSAFFNHQPGGSFASAVKFVAVLEEGFVPDSVADVGCGRGTRLEAFKSAGASNLVEFDGDWVTASQMVCGGCKFIPTDLNFPIKNRQELHELAVSVEVAEHLESNSSQIVVESLVAFSDAVLSGAAYTDHGSTDQLNERAHSFCAELSIERKYLPYDLFRPNVWGDDEVEF